MRRATGGKAQRKSLTAVLLLTIMPFNI